MNVNELRKKQPAELTDDELEKVMAWGWNIETGTAGWKAFEACWEEYQKRDRNKAEAFIRKLPA